MLGQQVLRAGIMDILGIANIADIVDICGYQYGYYGYQYGYCGYCYRYCRYCGQCGYCRLDIINVAVETGKCV